MQKKTKRARTKSKPRNVFDGNQKIELSLDPKLMAALEQLVNHSLSQEERNALNKLRRTSRQLLNKAESISTEPPTN